MGPNQRQRQMCIRDRAQINGWRGNTSLEKRIEHDLYYIERWSVWLDLKILLLTVFKGFVDPNAY